MSSDPHDSVSLAAAVSAVPAEPRPDAAPSVLTPRRRTSFAVGAAVEEQRSKTLRHAARYSRFVRAAKIMLPVSAFAIVAAMLVFAFVYESDDRLTVRFSNVQQVDNDLRMVNPQFSGVDAERRPFLVTAEAAIQDPQNLRAVTLQTLQADMALSPTAWVSVNADEGLLDTESETLTLAGSIDVYSDTGYEFHMERATIDFNEHRVETQSPVVGQGPLGTLRADRFIAEDTGQNLRFDGNVRMRIFPPARSDD